MASAFAFMPVMLDRTCLQSNVLCLPIRPDTTVETGTNMKQHVRTNFCCMNELNVLYTHNIMLVCFLQLSCVFFT